MKNGKIGSLQCIADFLVPDGIHELVPSGCKFPTFIFKSEEEVIVYYGSNGVQRSQEEKEWFPNTNNTPWDCLSHNEGRHHVLQRGMKCRKHSDKWNGSTGELFSCKFYRVDRKFKRGKKILILGKYCKSGEQYGSLCFR